MFILQRPTLDAEIPGEKLLPSHPNRPSVSRGSHNSWARARRKQAKGPGTRLRQDKGDVAGSTSPIPGWQSPWPARHDQRAHLGELGAQLVGGAEQSVLNRAIGSIQDAGDGAQIHTVVVLQH